MSALFQTQGGHMLTVLLVLAALWVAVCRVSNKRVNPLSAIMVCLFVMYFAVFGTWLTAETQPLVRDSRKYLLAVLALSVLLISPLWWLAYPGSVRILISFAWLVAALAAANRAADPQAPYVNFYFAMIVLLGVTMMTFPIVGRLSLYAAVAIVWFWYAAAVGIILWPVVVKPCLDVVRQWREIAADARATWSSHS